MKSLQALLSQIPTLTCIRVKGVKAYARHGVREFEKTQRQEFSVDIDAYIEAPHQQNDALSSTLSYSTLAQKAAAIIRGPSMNLIETLAENIASMALSSGALAVNVSVHKPEAPIRVPCDEASVNIWRAHPIASSGIIRRYILSLGSNMGDRQANLERALEELTNLRLHMHAYAPFYQNSAHILPGQGPQPDFLNTVAIVTTDMAPLELLDDLHDIEVRLGRVRHERWGARTIDIDIVDIEGIKSAFPSLVVPHPRAHERDFVLVPWAHIDAQARLGNVPVSELVEKMENDVNKSL